MTLWLENRVAIVTGAGRGIGRATAMLMAREGARVVVNDLGCELDGSGTSGGPADSVVEEIEKLGGEAVANYENVATVDSAKNIAQCALDNFGHIDILVNNAGIHHSATFVDTTEDDFDKLMATYLKGQFCCLKAVVPHMISQKYGRIVNLSSGSGLFGVKGAVIYSTAKAGILGSTRALAVEMEEYGITVNAVLPLSGTRMMSKILADVAAGTVTQAPGGIDQLPETIAPLIVYLAGEKAGRITGRTFSRRLAGTVQLMSESTPVKSAYKDGVWTIEEIDKVMPQLVPEVG